MRLWVTIASLPLILLLALTYRVDSDRANEKWAFHHYDEDDKTRQWGSEEDKAFSESGICVSQNLSYVQTCGASDQTVRSLHALKRAQCFCDLNCHKYGDCCLDRLSSDSYYHNTLPWSCRVARGKANIKTPLYVLQKCSEEWEDVRVRTMCEREAADLEKIGESFSHLQDIPVKSKRNGMFYRNVYCAMCNHESELEQWNSTLFCSGVPFGSHDEDSASKYDFSSSKYNTRTQRFLNVYVEGRKADCRLIVHDFETGTLIDVHGGRLCKPVINTCGGHVDYVSWQKCNSYSSYVYENGYPFRERKVYKNFHCALCRKANVDRIKCVDPAYGGTADDPLFGAALNFLFDFNYAGGNNRLGVTSPCELSEGLIWDDVLKKCENFTCGSLFVRKGAKCVPRVTENVHGGLNDTCLKRTLTRDAFVMHANGSVYVKLTYKTLLLNEYEINERDGADAISINVCADEGSYLLHLSRDQYLLSEVTLSLSIVCLTIHLFAYSVLKELRNCPGKILMSLSACMICGHVFLLTGQHIAGYYSMCYIAGVLTHFGYLSSFLWMNVMAYDIYRTFSMANSRNPNNKKTFIKYSAYCWLTAMLITSFSVSFDHLLSSDNEFRPMYGDPICWFNQRKGLLIFFIIPIFILLVMNVIFFSFTAFRIRKISKETKMVKNFSDKVRYLLYVKLTVVFGLTWLLGILAGIQRVSFLWYPFILLNGLQGVFIFVAFTIKRKIIKMLLVKFRINSDSYKMGKQSAIRKAIYSSLSNLSTLQTTVISQLPNPNENREILKAVRKINPDAALQRTQF